MIHKALLIAISYRGTSAELRGCVSDQERLYDYLKKASPDCEIRILCDDSRMNAPIFATPTKYNILRQIEWLVAGADKNTHVWLSYSGHGGTQRSVVTKMKPSRWRRNLTRQTPTTRVVETNDVAENSFQAEQHENLQKTTVLDGTVSSAVKRAWPFSMEALRRRRRKKTATDSKVSGKQEEKDGKDETLVPSDFRTRGHITDDVLRKYLVDKLPYGSKLTAFFDCCHSGTVLDLRYNWLDKRASGKNPTIEKSVHKNCEESKGHVLMLSGCLDHQTAADAYMDNKFCGATTQAFLHHMHLLTEQMEAAAVEDSSARAFGDGSTHDGNLDTLEELLHSMNKWMYENKFAQRPQVSLGRNELTKEAIKTFFPPIKK